MFASNARNEYLLFAKVYEIKKKKKKTYEIKTKEWINKQTKIRSKSFEFNFI